MLKQDQLHRLRRCTLMPISWRLRASAQGWLAVLLTACTPLTGAETSEQGRQADVAVGPDEAPPDAGPPAADQPDSRVMDAGAKDRSARGKTDSAGGSAAPKDAGAAGRAGDMSISMDMPGMSPDANAGAAAKGGGDAGSDLVDVTCVPLFVQEARGQFVQVRCQTAMTLGADQVEYLALPTKTQPATSTRFSELASAALLRAAPIGVRVSAAGRGNDSGCETARCRTIRAFSQGM